MTEQELPRLVPNTRGGDEKTTVETDLASFQVDLDTRPSAERWIDPPYTPVIIDLPGTLH